MAQETIVIRIETGKAQQSVAKLDKGIKQTGKSAKQTGKGLSGAFGAMKQGVLSAIPALNALKVALISTGVGAIVVAVGALVGVFVKAAKAGAEFGKGVSTLRAVTGKTADELERVTEQAKELGATTAFTAKQVLGLQTELAKLGFTLQDIENATPAILDLAASLEIGLGEAAAFAGSTVRAFGLETSDTQRLVDVFAKSTSATALDFDKLRESLKLVAPTASAVGISVERTTALLGGLANTGLAGSMAGTGLSKTFIELSKKGMTLEEAMDAVNSSSNKLNTAIDLVGINGGRALLNLAKVGGDELDKLEQKFLDAEGAAGKMAEVRLDNLEGDMTKLGSAWEGFLLGLEDGEGPLNKIQRIIVQGLTYAIQGLGEVVDFVAFAYVDKWENLKLRFTSQAKVIQGVFITLGGAIKKFANQALLQISRIPLLGRSIDKAAAERRIKEANQTILNGAKKLQEGVDGLKQVAINKATFFNRFLEQRAGKAERVAKAEEAKKTKELEKKIATESAEAREKRIEERKKELEKLAKLQEKFLKQGQDLEDKSELEKAERKRQRALAEIEALKLTEAEKREAIKQVNDNYDIIEKEAKQKDVDAENERKAKEQEELVEKLSLDKETEALGFEEQRALIEERRALLLEDETLSNEQRQELLASYQAAEEDLDKKKVRGKQQALSAVIAVAGAETGVGKALLIAKQALAMKETLMELKQITFKGKKAVAEAGVDAASNVSSSAKIGFPQNIITIAMAIGQGIALMRSVKKAVSKTGTSGGAGAAPTVPTPTAAGTDAGAGQQMPAFNIVGSGGTNQLADAISGQQQQPIKAYVTSDDVTTAQSMERNIVDGATIG